MALVLALTLGSGASADSDGAGGLGEAIVRGAQRLNALPPSAPPIALFPWLAFRDFDAARGLPARLPVLRIAATPGESEPAEAILVAGAPLRGVRVDATVSWRRSAQGAGSPEPVLVRELVRTRRRVSPRSARSLVEPSFLPPWLSQDIEPSAFRELWLDLRVPSDAVAGIHRGTLSVASADHQVASLAIEVEVYPFRLEGPGRKSLGIYYLMREAGVDPEVARRELADLRAHGISQLEIGTPVGRSRGAPRQPDASLLAESLDRIRAAGFSGTVVAETGFEQLAREHGYAKDSPAVGLESDPSFDADAALTVAAFDKAASKADPVQVVATHLDEVFSSSALLQRYLRLSEVFRRHSKRPLYITLSMAKPGFDPARSRIDPYVDLRSVHGPSFEQWLCRGHTMEEYERELQRSGDRSWFYHNDRGAFFTAEWSRVINGLYLWAGPFEAHVPWAYHYLFGNPFDESDGKMKDFAMAVADPIAGGDLVPHRSWEAMREGYDDLQYLAALERRLASGAGSAGARAQASRFLADLRKWVRSARPGPRDPGVAVQPFWTSSIAFPPDCRAPGDAPLVDAMVRHIGPEGWQLLRRSIADHVEAIDSGR